ncbi:MAG TPA: FecR domain-containing protein, partial [Actinomycetota bacterium]|nr:FecR domain-containing protein [Actinomycetota bacterium]
MTALLAALGVIAGFIGVAVQARSSEPSAVAALQVVRPSVDLATPGQPERAGATGEGLVEGSTVRTGPIGLAIVDYPDGSLTRLAPATTFTVETLRSGPKTRDVVGRLEAGRSWQTVKKATGSGSRFEIHTSSAIGAVRGTRFGVSCLTEICTYAVGEGIVEVISDGRSALVHGGEQVDVPPTGGPGEVEPLDTANPWVKLNMGLDDLERPEVVREWLTQLSAPGGPDPDPADFDASPGQPNNPEGARAGASAGPAEPDSSSPAPGGSKASPSGSQTSQASSSGPGSGPAQAPGSDPVFGPPAPQPQASPVFGPPAPQPKPQSQSQPEPEPERQPAPVFGPPAPQPAPQPQPSPVFGPPAP